MNIKPVACINVTARPIGAKRGKQQVPRQILDSTWFAFHAANRANTPASVQAAHGRVQLGPVGGQQNGVMGLGFTLGYDPHATRAGVDETLRNANFI